MQIDWTAERPVTRGQTISALQQGKCRSARISEPGSQLLSTVAVAGVGIRPKPSVVHSPVAPGLREGIGWAEGSSECMTHALGL